MTKRPKAGTIDLATKEHKDHKAENRNQEARRIKPQRRDKRREKEEWDAVERVPARTCSQPASQLGESSTERKTATEGEDTESWVQNHEGKSFQKNKKSGYCFIEDCSSDKFSVSHSKKGSAFAKSDVAAFLIVLECLFD